MTFKPAELEHFPGYYIRRLQQIAVAVFADETQAWGVTPVQFAALSAIMRQPGVDQRTLARLIGFDASTIGSVLDRLEARGLVTRSGSPKDRRVRLLHVTEEGVSLLKNAEPAVLKAQQRILEPLTPERRAQFMDLITFLIKENDELARAPSSGFPKEA
ncbi:MarR family transcriptional regulator [Ottowia caeni]|uniref:MarR family winged helix-turn-helix transcriptional regulator n=1 Tax=Ottowia caeni TaxID=2870339 RepID=UPI001E3717EF|nr:MarR family transcriptional regulator [Ottowia caeni]